MKIVKPDYSPGTVGTINSLLNYFHVAPHHATNPIVDQELAFQPETVIFVILDGLGERLLRKLYPHSWLTSKIRSTVTAVFPSTTTAAITTYHNGYLPIEHGWLGWTLYFKETNRYINPLPHIDALTGQKIESHEVDNRLFIAYPTVFEQIAAANPDSPIETYYISQHKIVEGKTGPQTNIGVTRFEEALESIWSLTATPGKKYIYLYWPSPDMEMHRSGTTDPQVMKLVETLSQQLEQLASRLAPYSHTMVISADHGHLDQVEILKMTDYPDVLECCTLQPFIEPRAISFHIKPERLNHFPILFNRYFKNDYLLLTKQEFLSANYLGVGSPHPKINDFLGDYIAIAISNRYIHIGASYYEMKSHHAGMTEDEMMVAVMLESSRGNG